MMRLNPVTQLIVIVGLITASMPLAAYIGPGAGIPVLGSLLGIIAAVVLALAAILAWPVRRMMKNRRRKTETPADEQEPGSL